MNYEIDVYDKQGKGKIILRLSYVTRTPEDEPVIGNVIHPFDIIQSRPYPVVVDEITESTAFYGVDRPFDNWNGIIVKAHLVNEENVILQIIEDKKLILERILKEETDKDILDYCKGYGKALELSQDSLYLHSSDFENRTGIFEYLGYKDGRRLSTDMRCIRKIWEDLNDGKSIPVFFRYCGL
jgi:hypothetical protein